MEDWKKISHVLMSNVRICHSKRKVVTVVDCSRRESKLDVGIQCAQWLMAIAVPLEGLFSTSPAMLSYSSLCVTVTQEHCVSRV